MERRGTPDFLLLLLTFLFVGFGIVMVFSASSPVAAYEYGDTLLFTKKQLIAGTLGAILLLLAMNVPYTKLKKGYLPFFVCTLGLLVAVLLQPAGGKPRSWIDLGFFSIQPAELAKLAIILYLSSMICKKGEKFERFKNGLLPVAMVVGFVAFLILKQPDFGSAFIFLCCSAIVIVAGGANMKHLLLGAATLAVAGAVFIGNLAFSEQQSYKMDRIQCYLDPWADKLGGCWQNVQAELAFGHGGIGGAGFGQSIQKLFYLPEAHNDFIFAIMGEELGFIGTLVFLLLFLLYLWRGIIVSLRCPDPFGTLVGIGIIGMFGIQALINIGGVTRAIPMTGITLPFISYGGSSLLVCMLSSGILLSISRDSSKAAVESEKQPRVERIPQQVPRIRS
ncbi:putative lipid II flippase FtsW [Paenibacillus thermotolerans]|uniref:putative lipid II flippase FtsW n=1 Tax=Paenibacillus thermotolerans TaxID=3027807 RepID=UPI0023687556|nr:MULTISPECIES: putative lipid II flippase FtsW [unclassified Paenibacillus]